MVHCSFIPIDILFVFLSFFFLVIGFTTFLTFQTSKRKVLTTFHQCLTIVVLVIILHYLCGYSLSMGRNMFYGVLSDFTESILLIDWNLCDISTNRSTLLMMGLESVKACTSIFIILSTVVGKMKPIHTMILLFTWYSAVYIPFVSWIRNPNGWIANKFNFIDLTGTFITHGLSGCFALGISLFFPQKKESSLTSKTPTTLQHEDLSPIKTLHEKSPSQKLITNFSRNSNSFKNKLIDPNVSSRRIRSSDPIFMAIGGWTTFIALVITTVSSQSTGEHGVVLSLVNASLCGLLSSAMFYYSLYTLKKASLSFFSYGLIAGVISSSSFAGATDPLYVLPIGVFISIVSLVFMYISDKIPRLRPSIFSFSINGISGLLSVVTMGFLREIPAFNLTENESDVTRGFIQLGFILVISIITLSFGFIIGFIFRYILNSEIPHEYLEKGLDHIYTFEKSINTDNEDQSDTDSEYETYTESIFVRRDIST